ncbi:MAG: O-antigen ligase family protein [Bacteroidota bacterium]
MYLINCNDNSCTTMEIGTISQSFKKNAEVYSWQWLLVAAALTSLLVALAIAKVNWLFFILPILLAIGIPLLVNLMVSKLFGVYLMVSIAFFMNTFLKLIPNLPIGLLMDFCILVMILTLLYDCYWKNSWKEAFGSPITWVIVVWSAWHLIELANPIAASRLAWFYVMRPALGYIMIFFVTYRNLHNLAEIKKLFFFIIILTCISAAWGVAQFILGYFPFEMNYIIQHDAVHLVFIQGRWRSFGTMGSPAHYGVIMAYMTVACWLLLGTKYAFWQKFIILITSLLAVTALVFSGARSGFAVLPISLIVVVGLSRNIKFYMFSAVAGVGLILVLITPSDNYHIQRIQSTFKGSEDESFNIREENRAKITPWILAHPMGGGLGSTGVWGQRFSPGTFLANFPPDSGYVRVAVEMGWIGFLLYLLLWLVILWHSIFGQLQLKERCKHIAEEYQERRLMSIAIIASIVPITVVETAQDIIGKLPSNLLFWIWVAMLIKLVKPNNKVNMSLKKMKTDKTIRNTTLQ